MVELLAKSPGGDLLPKRIGKVDLVEADLGALTSLMPFRGQENALSSALKAAYGMTLPSANRATGKAEARAIWFGHGQVLLAGAAPDASLGQFAALSDQSDAWACVELSGPGVQDVLARLVPVDLRREVFKTGHTARSMIQHMHGSVTRIGADRFLLMVFRSTAATLVHDLVEAMETVAAKS